MNGNAPEAVGGTQPLLTARGLVKHYGDVEAVRGVDFDLPSNGFVTILGPSGCGKTTILRMIGGFESITAGELVIEGRTLAGMMANRRPVNTVFQNYALFPHLTVFDNVAFGLRLRRLDHSTVRERVIGALATVQMETMAARYPFQLSGGQQQRVALARAYINEPRLLLLDEPLGALDLKMRRHMQVELKDLQRRLGMTFLYVTHDQEEAFALSDWVIVMNEGRIEQHGVPAAIYHMPDNAFVADFIGGANLVAGTVVEAAAGRTVLDCPLGRIAAASADELATGDSASLCVRAENVTVGNTAVANALSIEVRVTHVVFQGDTKTIEGTLDGLRIEASVAHDFAIEVGDRVTMSLPERHVRIVRGVLATTGGIDR